MQILAIDPGDKLTAFVHYDTRSRTLLDKGKITNEEMLTKLVSFKGTSVICVIEYPVPRGQPMYTQLIDTIFWIGRYVHEWGTSYVRMDRKDVKMTLCGKAARVGDSHVRAAILSLFSDHPQQGGGKLSQIGNKKHPGVLYGVSKDIWAALAVALTYEDITNRNKVILDNMLN